MLMDHSDLNVNCDVCVPEWLCVCVCNMRTRKKKTSVKFLVFHSIFEAIYSKRFSKASKDR